MRAGLAGALLAAAVGVASAAGGEIPLALERRIGGDVILSVEVADTPERRAVGLMERDVLPPQGGMLFDYGRPTMARMWMRRTRIPLDMLFIDEAGVVRHLHPMARPFDETVIAAPMPVRWVLEIGGGYAAALGLSVGDRMRPPPAASP